MIDLACSNLRAAVSHKKCVTPSGSLRVLAGLIWLSYQSMFLDWIAVDRFRGGGCDLGGPLV